MMYSDYLTIFEVNLKFSVIIYFLISLIVVLRITSINETALLVEDILVFLPHAFLLLTVNGGRYLYK